jgi:DNA-binding CsgD family transcriptional regulator
MKQFGHTQNCGAQATFRGGAALVVAAARLRGEQCQNDPRVLPMPDPTLDDVVRLTERFYGAALDDKLWAEAIGDLQQTLDAPDSSFGLQDASGAMQVITGTCEPDYLRTYAELSAQNPFVAWMARQQVGTSLTEENFTSRAEFERTMFYNEWMVPQDMNTAMFTRIDAGGGAGCYLNVNRRIGQRMFDSAEIAFVQRLAPTLTRAVALRARAGAQSIDRRSNVLERVNVGMVVTDGDGRVLVANRIAQLATEQGEGIATMRGRLVALNASEGARLAALIDDAAPRTRLAIGHGGDLLITSRRTGLPLYALSVRPLPGDEAFGLSTPRAVLVVVQRLSALPRSGFEETVRSLFDLSEKEAQLAAALVSGLSLREAAFARGIGMATARTQLSQIFRKTNTTQQSQMVALLLSILPVG